MSKQSKIGAIINEVTIKNIEGEIKLGDKNLFPFLERL